MSKVCVKVAASKRAKAHVRCFNKSDRSKGGGSDSEVVKGGSGGGGAPNKNEVKKISTGDYFDATQNTKKHVKKAEYVDAVKYYTGEKYIAINNCKRKQTMCGSVDQKKIENLQDVLSIAPKYEGVSYRGMSFSDKEKFDSFVGGVKKGGTFTDKGFMSTAYNKTTANNFQTSGYSVLITVKGKTGVAVRELSSAPTENEILFNAGTSFVVKNIKKSKNSIELEIEEP